MNDNPANPVAIVVGTGFGSRVHVPALRAAGFEVAALVGTDAERTAKRAQTQAVAGCFTDLGEAIAQTGATVITIATPPSTHAPLTRIALSHGCHVVCEKPFAMDSLEAKELLAAAKTAGVMHVVGHEFRWSPERAAIGQAIAQGLIGEPRLLTLTQYLPLLASTEARMPRWWFDRQAGGGWLGAQGSHIIDQIRCWLGEFVSVSASLPMASERSGVAEDSYVVRFSLVNGVEGVLQQTAGAWGPSANFTRLAGTRGTLWTEAGVVKLATQEGVREVFAPPPSSPGIPVAKQDAAQRPAPPELESYTQLCIALRAAIEGRDAVSSSIALPTFADGVACMQVMDAIRASAAAGGELVRVGA